MYALHRLRRHLNRLQEPPALPNVTISEHSLMKCYSKSTWYGVRNHAMIAAFCDTGLRLSELIGLDVDDIDVRALWHLLFTQQSAHDQKPRLINRYG